MTLALLLAATPRAAASRMPSFSELVTAVSPGPVPGDMAVVFADGSAALVEGGKVVVRVGATPSPVTWAAWLSAPPQPGPPRLPALVFARRSSGNARTYFVERAHAGAPVVPLPACAAARGVQVEGMYGVQWWCGATLHVADIAGGPPAARAFLGSAATFTVHGAAPSPGAGNWAASDRWVAVRNATGIWVDRAAAIASAPIAVASVSPGVPVHMAWSAHDALAAATPSGVYLWSQGLGARSFPAIRGAQALAWLDDGAHVEVLSRLNQHAEPPRYAVYRLGMDGSVSTAVRGRLGYVLGFSAEGSALWREEGVSAGVYAAPSRPGPGPFHLQAVAMPVLPNGPLPGIRSLAMANPSVGWALTEDERLLLTQDSGSTWRDVTPAGYGLAPARVVYIVPGSVSVGAPGTVTWARTSPCEQAACYTGWAYAMDASGRPTLLRSDDGGLTWQDLHPPASLMQGGVWPPAAPLDRGQRIYPQTQATLRAGWRSAPLLDFVNDRDGWMMTFPCCGASGTLGGPFDEPPQGVMLARTTDGGRTWSASVPLWAPGSGGPAPAGSPPLAGTPTGMSFATPSRGWVVGVARGSPWLYATEDGGAAWRNVRLPPVFENPALPTETEPPRFFGARQGVLPVLVDVQWRHVGGTAQYAAAENAPGPWVVLYLTKDGGATWTPTKPLPVHFGSSDGVVLLPEIAIADAEGALVYDGVHGFATRDGGTTWTPVSAPSLLGAYPVQSLTSAGVAVGAPSPVNFPSTVTLLHGVDAGSAWRRESATLDQQAVSQPWAVGGVSGSGWSGTPFAVSLGTGAAAVRRGADVPLEVTVAQTLGAGAQVSVYQLRLFVRISAGVRVVGAGDGTTWSDRGPTVWEAALPPVSVGTDGASLQFTWNGRTAGGTPVPAGVYFADIELPVADLEYNWNGETGEELVPAAAAASAGQRYSERIDIVAGMGR